jgi:hypothetical protein
MSIISKISIYLKINMLSSRPSKQQHAPSVKSTEIYSPFIAHPSWNFSTYMSVLLFRIAFNTFKNNVRMARFFCNSPITMTPTPWEVNISQIKIPRRGDEGWVVQIDGCSNIPPMDGYIEAEWVKFPHCKAQNDKERVILYLHGGKDNS